MMNKQVYQRVQVSLLFLTLLILGAAFYFEYIKGQQPCPLCLMQRLCLVFFALSCVAGCLLYRIRSVGFVQMFFAASGLFFSIRQLWLQSLPIDEAPMCMPGLDALVHYFSWSHILNAFFWGTAACAETTWLWLGLSMPAWSACYFFGIFSVSAFLFFQKKSRV